MINISDHIEVTEDDINYAEKILFGKTKVFDCDERVPIIKNFNESFDVNACPGSGKTTVLLAKLIILSRKMPFKNGEGICVLTHTNVAINEIKDKLKDKSDILFKYPNFFGTIQSFIDRYLCIPYYKMKTGNDVRVIGGNNEYRNELIKLSNNYYNYPNIKYAIDYALRKNSTYYINKDYKGNLLKFVNGKEFKVLNNDVCICNKNGGKNIENLAYADELHKIMYNGALTYKDTYIFSEAYLSRFPNLIKYFSSRFKYVFIDEMQDTSAKLENILSKVFQDDQSTIIQRFGDINQRIGLDKEESGWVLSDNVKYINSSKRYGNEMIKFLEPLRIVKGSHMSGNKSIKTLNPHIIIFNEQSVNLVINKFTEIINKYNIDKSQGKIKVIGKIGIDVEYPNLSITSYTDCYKRNDKKKPNNKDYYSLIESRNLKEFYDNLLMIIISALKFNDKKVSKSDFIKYMKFEKDNEFNLYKANVKEWFCDKEKNTVLTLATMKEKTIKLLNGLEKYEFKEFILEEKLSIPTEEELAKEEVASTMENEKNTQISDIATVFGVKGETHLATLYLETKRIEENETNLRSDIMKILDYMLNKKDVVDEEDEEALIAAYVAMSRAQQLTCIAISYDTIKGRIRGFSEYGYKIIACDDEIEELINQEL